MIKLGKTTFLEDLQLQFEKLEEDQDDVFLLNNNSDQTDLKKHKS